VTLGLLAPGSMLSQAPLAGRLAAAEAVVPLPGGSECAAVSCNRGSTTSSGTVPTVAVAGMLLAAAVILPLRRAWRRTRTATFALPAGSPFDLQRPPQQPLPA